MEQADVPLRSDRAQEIEQRAGPLGKLEAIQPFVLEVAGVPAHHVAHVQLRHLVVGHVPHREARVAQSLYEGGAHREARRNG